ncbi:MAG: hypothetical protein U0V74_04170 [Chitinophagales bacterium]
MAEIVFTVVKQRVTPITQGVVALAVGLVGMLIVKAGGISTGSEYFSAIVAIILFTILNTVVSVANESYTKYTVPSYGVYLVIVAVLFLSAKLFSGLSVWETSNWVYRMMITSITLFYVIISVLVRAIRFLYDMAESGM